MNDHTTRSRWVPPEARSISLAGRGRARVYDVAGPTGAPTVVLLHGLGATAALNWPGAFDALSSEFRVVALDQRGHSGGLRTRRPFRLQDCADDVAALADALDIEQFIPVGYSMGGPVAMLAGRRHPDRVAGMVLCATAAVFRADDSPAGGSPYAAMFAASLRFTPPIVRRRMMATMIDAARRRGSMPAALAAEARRHDPAAIVEATRAVGRFDARPWAATLEGPAAAVITERDSMVPAFRQRELAAIVGATEHPIEADHDVCARRPARFLTVLAEACRTVAAKAAAPLSN